MVVYRVTLGNQGMIWISSYSAKQTPFTFYIFTQLWIYYFHLSKKHVHFAFSLPLKSAMLKPVWIRSDYQNVILTIMWLATLYHTNMTVCGTVFLLVTWSVWWYTRNSIYLHWQLLVLKCIACEMFGKKNRKKKCVKIFWLNSKMYVFT